MRLTGEHDAVVAAEATVMRRTTVGLIKAQRSACALIP